MNPSPYSAPPSANEEPTAQVHPQTPSSLRHARTVFYIHLAVVGFFAAASLTDVGVFMAPIAELPGERVFNFIVAALAMSWNVCPVYMAMIAADLKDRPISFRVGIVGIDVLLSAVQLLAMTPLVQ